MPSADQQHPGSGSRGRAAIVRTLILQLTVLLALSAATIAYLEWSSEANLAEFGAASRTAGIDSIAATQRIAPVRTAKADPCRRGH